MNAILEPSQSWKNTQTLWTLVVTSWAAALTDPVIFLKAHCNMNKSSSRAILFLPLSNSGLCYFCSKFLSVLFHTFFPTMSPSSIHLNTQPPLANNTLQHCDIPLFSGCWKIDKGSFQKHWLSHWTQWLSVKGGGVPPLSVKKKIR